ncbi:MAG: hypothetical protein ACREAE_08865, partial [Nitrosopumilaceae archaeon]
LKVYNQEEEKIKQTLRRARITLQSSDHRQWEIARKELFELLEKWPKNQEANVLLRKVNEKLFNYWILEASKNLATDSLANALDCFKTSLDYAYSQKREQVIEKYRQTAIRLAHQIEARRAQQEAKTARDTGKLREALRKLTEAITYDNSLAKEIQPIIAKLERQVAIDSLESLYYSAKKEKDRYSARAFLLQLIKLAPDSSKYNDELKVVDSAIRSDKVWYAASIAILTLGGVVSILLMSSGRFRERFVNFFHGLSMIIPRLRYGDSIAILMILLVGYFCYRLHQSKTLSSLETLPRMTIWGGIAVLTIIIVMALIHKRISMRFVAVSKQISLFLQQPRKLISQQMSGTSLQLQSIASLKIERGTLREKKDGALLAENDITFRPYDGNIIENVEFMPVDTHLLLNALSFAAGTQIFFEKDGEKISLGLEGRSVANSFDLSPRFRVKVRGCEIFCEGRSVTKASINESIELYGELAAFRPIVHYQVHNGSSCLVFSIAPTENYQLPLFEVPKGKKLSFNKKEVLRG